MTLASDYSSRGNSVYGARTWTTPLPAIGEFHRGVVRAKIVKTRPMEDGVGAKDDPSERYREDQRDDELRKRWQDFNLETEITLLRARGAPVGDRAQELIGRKLVRAQGLLGLALDRGFGFSDAVDASNEVLELDPASGEAFAIRALAHSRLDSLHEAVDDAETAIALNPGDPSVWGVTMRSELPSWRKALGT